MQIKSILCLHDSLLRTPISVVFFFFFFFTILSVWVPYLKNHTFFVNSTLILEFQWIKFRISKNKVWNSKINLWNSKNNLWNSKNNLWNSNIRNSKNNLYNSNFILWISKCPAFIFDFSRLIFEFQTWFYGFRRLNSEIQRLVFEFQTYEWKFKI